MWLIGTIVIAWLLADFIAGFWHWIEDRFLGHQYNIFGFKFDKPNSSHHDDPQGLLELTYWGRNYLSIIVAIPLILISIILNWPLFITLSFLFASQANEIHAFAHNKGKLHPFIVMLQEVGIFQSPKHHSEHHRSPFLIKYCVSTNFVNPVLDYFDFWRRLENLVVKIGIKTNE
jgi:ubiquitin-conjugating enzyme E2 variant